jgi:hypothetical protein
MPQGLPQGFLHCDIVYVCSLKPKTYEAWKEVRKLFKERVCGISQRISGTFSYKVSMGISKKHLLLDLIDIRKSASIIATPWSS